MPSVPSISFNVRYDLTSAPTLVLTDATTYHVGAIGIFTITQPDGYVRTGNFSSPDISSSGGTLSTALRLSSTGGVQCGTYTIKYEIRTTDLVISTFTREFVFTYVPVELNLKENFDVFTPSLSYSDMTLYGVNNYSNISPTRAWTAVSIPTGTKTANTSTISLQHNGSYYDAVYTITLVSTLTYQHTTYAWLSVLEAVNKTVVAEACTPEPLEDIIAMMETLRQNSINCAGDLPIFEKAQSLFSHLMDQVKMALLNNIPQDGIYDTYEDLMAILRNGQPCVHTNLPIDPYDLGDYAVSPYPLNLSYCDLIGDGYNTTYTVNHNLNDDCVIVQVYESSTGAQVLCDVTVSDNNNVVASFYTAPTTDQYKVVVYAGARGQIGPGVAAGGTIGQFLVKGSLADYETQWITPAFASNTRTLTINGLTQDLTADRTWSIPTIYNSDGTLTGNRTVNAGGFSLTLNPNLYLGGKVTGYTLRTYPVNFTNSGTSYNSAIQLDNTITANGGSQIFYAGQINSGTLTNDGTLGVLSSSLVGTLTSLSVRGLTSGARLSNTTGSIVNINRGDSTDISTSANNRIVGYSSTIIHPSNLPTTSLTGYAASFTGNSTIQSGIVTDLYGSDIDVAMSTSPIHANSSVSNYYAIRVRATIGATSGPTAILTSYYGLFLDTPSVRATGTISNRWGIYAPDVAMRHYLNGNLLLGSTSDTGLFKLDVTGAGRFTTSLDVGGLQLSPATSVAMYVPNEHSIRINNASGTLYIDPSNPVGSGNVIIRAASVSLGTSASTGSMYSGEYNSGIGMNGYALDGKRILLLKSDSSVLRFNDNTTVNKVGMRGAQYIFDGANDIINWTFEDSAIVDIRSTTKGFLAPRMTTTQKTGIATPAIGLVVYDNTLNSLNVYNGTTWVALGSGGGGGTNIYTADGTLTGNRTISTTSGYTLAINPVTTFNASTSASAGLGRGVIFTPTILPTANNDTVVGLDIYPSFGTFSYPNNLNSFTSFPIGVRISGNIPTNFNALDLVNNATNSGETISLNFYDGSFKSTFSALRYVLGSGGSTSSLQTFVHGQKVSEYFSTGNLLIQSGGTFTDGGQRLQVQGDAFIKGSGSTSATTALTIQNSLSGALFSVRNDGLTTINGNTTFLGTIAGSNAGRFVITGGNFAVNITSNNPNNGEGSLITTGAITTTDNQTKNVINVNNAVTSTSASFNTLNGFAFTSTINQTLGIIRGLYINPTLTASTDFRAIETTAGNVLFGSNFFWNNTNSRLGIGTNTPAYGLHNLGTSAFDNGNSGDAINILNGGFLNWGLARFRGFATTFMFQDASFNTKVSLSMAGNTSYFNTGGGFVFGNGTDAGQLIQVYGDAFIKGSGATSATTGLTVQNSAGSVLLAVRNDGNIYADGTNFIFAKYTAGGTSLTVSNAGHNGAIGISTTSAIGLSAASNLGVSVNNPRGASVYAAGGAQSGNISLGILSNRALISSAGTAIGMHASSMLQVDSTSQGFLPPRMTGSQLSAISSPAVGLVAYQTDGTEGLYQYKSTGWTLVAGSGGSTAYSVTSATTTYSETATSGTKIVKADTTGGAFTVSLPTAVGNTATIIIKKSAGTASLTIDAAGTETIDGGLTATITKVYESITLISDNANWQIV